MRNYTLDQLLGGLKYVESSGRYNAVGPKTKTGDQAYGAYQVMGANVPNWTQQVLGTAMTPQQFLSDSKAQDTVAKAKFGGYLQNGTPEDAISMWFSGRPMKAAGNASDGYMKTPDYVNKVLAHSGDQPDGPPLPFAPTDKSGSPVPFPGAPNGLGQPSAPMEEQTLVPGSQAANNPYDNVGQGLVNLGSVIAGLDRRNPTMAYALKGVAENMQRQRALDQKDVGWDVAGFNDDKTAALLRSKSTGEIKMTPMPDGFGGQKLQYKGLDTDKNGQTYDTFVNSRGELVRKPTDMVDPAMKAQEKLDEGDASFWGDYILTNPAALSQIPRNVRPQVMSSVHKLAEEAGFGGKDLYQTVQNNATNLVDYKKRANIVAQLDTFKGEFLSSAQRAAEYSNELKRTFGAMPLEQMYQWAEKNSGSENAVKINNLKTSLEAVSRSVNRAMSTASGGNVTGEERLAQLMNPSMSHDMIMGSLQVLTKDVLGLNQNARWALENQRARNGGKALPHPEIDDEKAAMEKLFGPYGGSKTGGGATPPAAGVPKAGDQVDGYRFKGGDPSKQENWEKI